MVSPEVLSEIFDCLSRERLKTYSVGDSEVFDEITLKNYLIQLKINRELYIPLHLFEIILRNRVHCAVSELLQNKSWLLDVKNSNNSSGISNFNSLNNKVLNRFIEEVKAASQKSAQNLQRSKREVGEGDLIANLSLGFWTSIISSSFSNILHNKGLFVKIFPYFQFKKLGTLEYLKQESELRDKIYKIRQERNRIFHHERVKNYEKFEAELWFLIRIMSEKSVLFFKE